jgi:DNA mismatch repair protein MutL
MKPIVADFMPKEANRLRSWMEPLKEIGFEVESFGGDSFVIHSVPASLSRYAPDTLLRGLMETVPEGETKPQWSILASLAKTAACHSAIRAGQRLQPETIHQLLKDLDQTAVSSTCPHGRPLWWKLTYEDIARFFRRT